MSAGKYVPLTRNGTASSSAVTTTEVTTKSKDKSNKLDDFNIVRTIGKISILSSYCFQFFFIVQSSRNVFVFVRRSCICTLSVHGNSQLRLYPFSSQRFLEANQSIGIRGKNEVELYKYSISNLNYSYMPTNDWLLSVISTVTLAAYLHFLCDQFPWLLL